MPKNRINQPIDRTELVWPNKRKEVERIELPFQTIETINLPRGNKQEDIYSAPITQEKLMKDKFKQATLGGQDLTWKNRLIWGDNLLIMGSLLKEYAGKINLIYIDPPFATGDDFSFEVRIGDQEITKEPSALEVKAYRDTWGKGMQSYLQMMYDRLVLMKELLADNGSIFVHLDYRVVHYIKIIMDEIFGKDNLRNEIAWRRGNINVNTASDQFPRNHDTILFYSFPRATYKRQLKPYSEATLKMYKFDDKDGKGLYRLQSIRTYSQESIENMRKEGRIVKTSDGGMNFKQYLSDKEGVVVDDVWEDLPSLQGSSSERIGYSTQKPESLLERIIKTTSKETDVIADFFCGSGTTSIVAEKLGRRWIMSDLGRFAIHTARKRLLDIGAKPFIVQNLGKYERHHWVKLNGRYTNYLKFILELYHAEPVEGFKNLHGKKDKAFVRVGAVDAPVTLSEIREALSECKENKIKALDVLGWEWEMGLHDLVKEEAEHYGVKLGTFQIPREVMELNVSDPKVKEDIHFYELAYLEAEPEVEGKRATITLEDFIIPNPELLPDEVKDKVRTYAFE